MATLTYVYADATAVLGPLSTAAEPHTYDLCARHAANLTVPQGWQVVRLADEFVAAEPSEEDLEALANVVRKAMRERPRQTRAQGGPNPTWDGRLSSESVTGSAGRQGAHYSMLDKQGLSGPPRPQSKQPPGIQRGHLRVLPGGLPD